MASPQFNVCREGDPPAGFGQVFPLLSCLVDGREFVDDPGRFGLHGLPHAGCGLMAPGRFRISRSPRFMLRPDSVLPGGASLHPGQPEFLGNVRRRPAGFPLVHPAPKLQLVVGAAAQVDALDPAEGRERGVPVGPGFRGGLTWLGPDRVRFAVIAVQLSVSAELGGAAFPDRPPGEVRRHISQRSDSPRGPGLRRVLAQPPHPVVHRGGQFGQVAAQFRVGHLRHPLRPGLRQLRNPAVEDSPYSRVNHADHVACPAE